MIIAIDVHYRTDHVKAISVEFDDWKAVEPDVVHEIRLDEAAQYIPGEFYKRELPCILSILEKSNLNKAKLIIVDGYVFLDDEKKPGLGAHLYHALEGKVPVIGVAKKAFKGNKLNVREIFRGESAKPLFVSCIDYNLELAAQQVAEMAGDYRMPNILKILDGHTKT